MVQFQHMAQKDIQTRRDAKTKDMQPEERREREFTFPTLGVSVKAATYDEAFKKAKEVIRVKNKNK